MNAVQEITRWVGDCHPNHIYLMDGNQAMAYIKQGTSEPYYFKSAITLNMSRRDFKPVSNRLFNQVKDTRIKVIGSKGTEYFVDPVEKTCTCPGYIYRGQCKHVVEVE